LRVEELALRKHYPAPYYRSLVNTSTHEKPNSKDAGFFVRKIQQKCKNIPKSVALKVDFDAKVQIIGR